MKPHLRYRGKDKDLKKAQSALVFSKLSSRINAAKKNAAESEYSPSDFGFRTSDITEKPAYLSDVPPKNAKIFKAFPKGMRERLRDGLIKTYQGILRSFEAFKSSSKLINEFYQSLSEEDKKFIQLISKSVAGHHIPKTAMSVLGISSPIHFVLFSLLMNVGLSSASNTTHPYPFQFIDGFPTNGTDLCQNSTLARSCKQFYVNYKGSPFCQAMSELIINTDVETFYGQPLDCSFNSPYDSLYCVPDIAQIKTFLNNSFRSDMSLIENSLATSGSNIQLNFIWDLCGPIINSMVNFFKIPSSSPVLSDLEARFTAASNIKNWPNYKVGNFICGPKPPLPSPPKPPTPPTPSHPTNVSSDSSTAGSDNTPGIVIGGLIGGFLLCGTICLFRSKWNSLRSSEAASPSDSTAEVDSFIQSIKKEIVELAPDFASKDAPKGALSKTDEKETKVLSDTKNTLETESKKIAEKGGQKLIDKKYQEIMKKIEKVSNLPPKVAHELRLEAMLTYYSWDTGTKASLSQDKRIKDLKRIIKLDLNRIIKKVARSVIDVNMKMKFLSLLARICIDGGCLKFDSNSSKDLQRYYLLAYTCAVHCKDEQTATLALRLAFSPTQEVLNTAGLDRSKIERGLVAEERELRTTNKTGNFKILLDAYKTNCADLGLTPFTHLEELFSRLDDSKDDIENTDVIIHLGLDEEIELEPRARAAKRD